MATIQEDKVTPEWVDDLYQIEMTDPVTGGSDGVANRQAKQLGQRTQYLKKGLGNLEEDFKKYKDKSSQASLNQTGLVRLTSNLQADAKSEDLAVTPKAVAEALAENLLVIDSIESLRNTENVRSNAASVKGYYSENPGMGGGVFVVDVADKTSADNGGTVIVSANGTRWRRVFSTLTPLDFGALGDNVTDDSEAFNALERFDGSKYVDLLGLTYLVKAWPVKTFVYNGKIRVAAEGVRDYSHKLLNSHLTVTVGQRGQFSTINEAITHIKNHYSGKAYRAADNTLSSGYAGDAIGATIRLLSGFVMREQVIVRQCDISYITLIADDDEVLIETAALTKPAYFGGTDAAIYPVFYAGDNASQLLVACKFRFDGVGNGKNRHFYVCNRNSSGHLWPGSGVINCPGRAVFARECSHISARTTYALGSGESGYMAHGASMINAQGARASDSLDGIACYAGSSINFERGVADNCKRDAVVAASCQPVCIDYASLKNAARYAIRAGQGATVAGTDVVAFGGDITVKADSAVVVLNKPNLDGSKTGIYANNNATVAAIEAQMSCTLRGVQSVRLSDVDISGSTLRGASEFGINANFGGRICAAEADVRVNGESDGVTDMMVSNGGVIIARNGKGGSSTARNQVSPWGYIVG